MIAHTLTCVAIGALLGAIAGIELAAWLSALDAKRELRTPLERRLRWGRGVLDG